MSLRLSAAHSSRVKKPKAPSFKRSSSTQSLFSSLPRRKPVQRSKSKPEVQEDEDLFGDRMDDVGLVQSLVTDLTLRDVAQTIRYVREHMFSPVPLQGAGMNSTRTAEVLNFRRSLPPIVSVAHIQALLNSPTSVEREIAELVKGGAIRKIVVPGRGGLGEVLILGTDLEFVIKSDKHLDEDLKQTFLNVLKESATALNIPRTRLSPPDAKALMHAGFLTSATPSWTSSHVFSRPGDGSRGTLTSLNSISKAASGSIAAVGGEGAVHAAGGSGGGAESPSGAGDFTLAIPSTGPFLKLLVSARAHLLSLLSKSKFRESPQDLLRERWDGGVASDDAASEARRNRSEFTGVLLGKTRKWKQFYGITFQWVLEECIGAGLVEVFETGSVGRGIRAL